MLPRWPACLAPEPSIYSGGHIEVSSALGTALGLSGLTGTTAGGSSCGTPGSGACYNGIITLATPAIVAGYGQSYYYRGLPGTGPQAGTDYDIFDVIQHEVDEGKRLVNRRCFQAFEV